MEESKQAKRTRKLVQNSFLSLIQDMKISDINVTDICKKAMITRATFYKYFEDKYHLVECIFEDFKEDVLDKKLESCTFDSLKDFYLKVIEMVVDFVAQNETLFVSFVKNGYDDRLRVMLMSFLNDYTESLISGQEEKFKIDIPIPILSKFITGGVVYLSMHLLESEEKHPKSQILEWADKVLSVLIK